MPLVTENQLRLVLEYWVRKNQIRKWVIDLESFIWKYRHVLQFSTEPRFVGPFGTKLKLNDDATQIVWSETSTYSFVLADWVIDLENPSNPETLTWTWTLDEWKSYNQYFGITILERSTKFKKGMQIGNGLNSFELKGKARKIMEKQQKTGEIGDKTAYFGSLIDYPIVGIGKGREVFMKYSGNEVSEETESTCVAPKAWAKGMSFSFRVHVKSRKMELFQDTDSCGIIWKSLPNLFAPFVNIYEKGTFSIKFGDDNSLKSNIN